MERDCGQQEAAQKGKRPCQHCCPPSKNNRLPEAVCLNLDNPCFLYENSIAQETLTSACDGIRNTRSIVENESFVGQELWLRHSIKSSHRVCFCPRQPWLQSSSTLFMPLDFQSLLKDILRTTPQPSSPAMPILRGTIVRTLWVSGVDEATMFNFLAPPT